MTPDIEGQFIDAMRQRGIAPPKRLIADGKLHRCDAEGRNGRGDAAYILHVDGLAAGGFQNHRDGAGWENWRAEGTRKLTPTERTEHRRRVAAMRAQRQADERERQAAAARRADGIWNSAAVECNGHPYLAAKQVGPHGARLYRDRLVVPVRDSVDGAITSLQFIDDAGTKRFLSGGRAGGGCFVIGEITDAEGVILIAESFGTGATLHEATGYPVVIAFGAGNLPAVAEMARRRFPPARIVIAADDDHETSGNPGVTKAREASSLVGGVVAVPEFGPNRAPHFTDFNDLGRSAGHDRVRAVIEAALRTLTTHVWRSKDADYDCTPTGVEWADDSDGRIYAEVLSPDGTISIVPKQQLFPKVSDVRAPEPARRPSEAEQDCVVRPEPPPLEEEDEFVWVEPIDIFGDLIGSPELRRDYLPDALAPFVFDTAERLGVDPAAVALCAIVTCSSVIHDDWRVQLKRDDDEWVESARLWGLILGGPATKKTPMIQACTRPVDALDARSRERHAEGMREFKRRHAAWKKRGGEDTPEDPEPRAPRLARRLVESTTIEALTEALRDDADAKQIAPAKKVLVRQDEMTEFFANLDRYNHGGRGGGDRGAYLRLDNGGRYTLDRIVRGAFAVPNWSACFLGGVQPEPVQRIAHEAADDGLLQRFFYFVADEAGDGIDRKPDREARERYASIITCLAGFHPGKSVRGQLEPVVLHADARTYWDRICRLVRAVGRLPDTSIRLRASLDKWAGRFGRIALAFHMIEAAADTLARIEASDRPMPVSHVLSPETARRTAAYMRHVLLPHLLKADALMFSSTESEHAKRIAGFILVRRATEVQMRDIVQNYKPLRAPEHARERESVMTSLTVAGWLEPVLPTARNPARPVTTWRVNPRVHALYAKHAAAEAERRRAAREALAELAQDKDETSKC